MAGSSIVIDGWRIRAKKIPKKQLISVWKALTETPFPKVKAFQLDDDDFNVVLELRKCRENDRRELLEWGRVLSVKGTDACVFSDGESAGIGSEADYVILLRENPYHRPREILEHELSHIIRGDL